MALHSAQQQDDSMTTKVTGLFSINGAIDTNRPVLENINDIATAAGAFISYDVAAGKWSVVINTNSSAVATFTDANIIGNIDISGSGISELYNSATIEYPSIDLRGSIDYLDVSIASGDRFANEVDNRLNFRNPLISSSAQARYIAALEVKQSRLDKVIQFRTDFSYLGLQAGDVIAVTNSVYGYSSKLFRIINIQEDDSEGLVLSITAQEFDSTIYSTTGLTIANRTKRPKIPPRQLNSAMATADDISVGDQTQRLILANIAAGLLNPKAGGLISSILKVLTGKEGKRDAEGNPTGEIVDEDGNPVLDTETANLEKVLGGAKAPALATISGVSAVCEGTSVTVIVGHSCTNCLFDIPPMDYPYTITGIDAGDINIPLTGTVTVTNGVGALTFTPTLDGTAEGTETATITIGGLTKTVTIYDAKDYTYAITKDNASITEGGTVVVTLTATGSKASASIPYTISGTASGKVSSPALSGTITTSGGTGTLTIVTTDDGTVQGTQGLTVTFEPGLVDPCGTVGSNSTSITVLDNDTAPPANTTCLYVSVPMTWCGVFNGSDDELQDLTIRASINLPVPRAGEATMFVPYDVTVTKGNPATITVTEEIQVASAALQAARGGRPAQLITSFDSGPPKGLIKGTTTTVYGY